MSTAKKTNQTKAKGKATAGIDHEQMVKDVADKFHQAAKELSVLAKKAKVKYDTEANRKILAGVAAATLILAGTAILKKNKKK